MNNARISFLKRHFEHINLRLCTLVRGRVDSDRQIYLYACEAFVHLHFHTRRSSGSVAAPGPVLNKGVDTKFGTEVRDRPRRTSFLHRLA